VSYESCEVHHYILDFIEEVLKKEWTDNVINKKESFVSAQSLATQKLIEIKENIFLPNSQLAAIALFHN
jgi:hypothetical protein